MRTNSIVLALATGLAVACGGGNKSSSPPAAEAASGGRGGGAAPAATATASTAPASGMPAWVARGSTAYSDGKNRVFYGVASASGIKNPPMLRSTADNRARNELAKIFEVFSASLMKDYSASTGEQQVEQAVKTFTSMSLEGVEIVDHYIAGDGTMYALAALDLVKVVEGVRKAKELGAFKSYVEKVDVNDIFEKHSQKPPPPPKPVVASGESAPAPANPPPASSGSSAKTRKEKPAWVDGQDPSYPWRDFLCGVGFGPQRPMAENGSYAAISRIFEVSVVSTAKDLMGAYSSTGGPTLEVQSSEQLTKVTTSKVVSGVKIYELWDGSGTIYALACLERDRAATALREQISEADTRVGKLLEKAESTDKAGKVVALGKALSALLEREALNGELRIVDADGVGLSGQYSHADVAAALEEAVSALRIGIRASGSHASDFRAAIMQGLTGRGWEITELPEGDDDEEDAESSDEPLDIEIIAKIRMENAGQTADNSKMSLVRGVVQMQVKNVAKNKVIATVEESRKEGHASLQEAERRAVRELAKKLATTAAAKIDDAIKGKK